MSQDRHRKEPRVSRSGRVLKKTLKIKEMEDLAVEEDRLEKNRKRPASHSVHRRLEAHPSAFERGTEGTRSVTSGDDSFYSKSKTERAPNCPEALKKFLGMNEVYSSADDSTGSSDVSSEDESSNSGSTDESSGHLSAQGPTKMNRRQVGEYQTAKCDGVLVAKRRVTPTIKNTSVSNKTNFHSYAQRKIENLNKRLIFSELCKRMGGTSPLEKKEQLSLQLCRELKGRKSAFAQGEPPEVSEGNPTLGIAPIDVAAHLTLLGDSLTKIGIIISNVEHVGPGVYSSFLDLLLCSVGPLLCLTREIPGLQNLPQDVFLKILDHLAYIIPGM